MPLLRRSSSAGGPVGGAAAAAGFKRPATGEAEDGVASSHGGNHKLARLSENLDVGGGRVQGVSGLTLRSSSAGGGKDAAGIAVGKRIVFYPELTRTSGEADGAAEAQSSSSSSNASGMSATQRMIATRLARRTEMDYHQPASVEAKYNTAATKAGARAAMQQQQQGGGDNGVSDGKASSNATAVHEGDGLTHTTEEAGVNGTQPHVVHGESSAAGTAGAALVTSEGGGAAADGSSSTGEEELPSHIVVRYPVSPYGKLYFQIETDAATRHEAVGIIIIDTEELGVMMYDRVGRQYGNRPDPGYPIRAEEVAQAKAGMTLRVGSKSVRLVTALTEESFRSGEFFLRSEHDMRVKEDKAKAVEAAAAAAAAHTTKPRMSFGTKLCGNLFAAQLFRRRPREGETGFVVPIAGRPKLNKNGVLEDLVPLHDPDRPNAVVLFRADYKRDANGRRQVSVVVDPVIGDKLRPHQRVGVRFLFDCIIGERMPGYHGAILADEMGLGKTIQTVATIYTCLKQGKHGQPTARKCLVVTPSSLVKNWCNEFDKWLGVGAVKHFAISESTPKGDRIISRFDGDGDVLVISYDQLRKYITRICSLKAIELVVCDEGHRLKNAEVKTTKAVDQLPTRNRIILSGTPIQNDLTEFHAMVGFVNPGILGNRDLFARVFEEPVLQGRDPQSPDHVRALGHDRAHYLSTLTQRFILRRTQTINESYLPPKVDVTVFVRLGAMQEKAYQALAEVVEQAACTPLVLISALRKLCNHMDLFADAVRLSRQAQASSVEKGGSNNSNNNDSESAGRKRGASRKAAAEAGSSSNKGIPLSVLPGGYRKGDLTQTTGSKIHFVSLVLDELRGNGDRDKLVIVSNFTQTLDIIAALCVAKKIAYFQLDGNTPIKKRQELVDYFNVPGSQELVFLLSSKAGGVGLNLIGANRLILFDPDWNPANDAQAMGRVWRDGQKKRVFIYRLLSTGTIEEKIYQRQVSKQGLSANVVDMQEDSKQHFTLEELKSLFKYKVDTCCETHDLLNCLSCEAAATLTAQKSRKGKDGAETAMRFRKVGEKKGGPRMDELKAWRHIADVARFDLDKVTRAVASQAPTLLSFLFADERDNTKKVAEPTVTIERPFVNDEEAIICASQAAMEEQESQVDIEVHAESDDDEGSSEANSVHSSDDESDE